MKLEQTVILMIKEIYLINVFTQIESKIFGLILFSEIMGSFYVFYASSVILIHLFDLVEVACVNAHWLHKIV